ncbi:MAG: hypothetical protein Q7S89_03000 [bacterium]|nr:hypothetical protein [bacterium]
MTTSKMTFLTFIPLAIIIIALAVIVIIFLRKLPVVAMVDVENLPEEQQDRVKRAIVEQRLTRRMRLFSGLIGRALLPVTKLIAHFRKVMAARIQKFEKRVREEEKQERKDSPSEVISEIDRLISEGEHLLKMHKYAEAEARFIEVVGMDPKNVDVYKRLAAIYEQQKDWGHALETWKFINKLEPNTAETCAHVGSISSTMGEHRQAVDWFFRAVHLESKNPRLLDLLIEESILAGNKKLAEETCAQLEVVNPENQKLTEFRERIHDMKEEVVP